MASPEYGSLEWMLRGMGKRRRISLLARLGRYTGRPPTKGARYVYESDHYRVQAAYNRFYPWVVIDRSTLRRVRVYPFLDQALGWVKRRERKKPNPPHRGEE